MPVLKYMYALLTFDLYLSLLFPQISGAPFTPRFSKMAMRKRSRRCVFVVLGRFYSARLIRSFHQTEHFLSHVVLFFLDLFRC